MSARTALSDYKIGKCRWCEIRGSMWRDTRYCEDCEINIIYCSVCKEDVHIDNKCRHVFRDDNYEWHGAGADVKGAALKPSFWKLLDLMPAGFAADLQIAIRSGRFHTWMMAPLIGGGGSLKLNGMPPRGGKSMLFEWGDHLIEIGGGDHAEKTANGYCWLVSLYDNSTSEANHTTIAWIEDWFMQCPD